MARRPLRPPFLLPSHTDRRLPHRLQFVRPCHIFPAFSPSQPPAPSIPPVSSQSINTDIQHSHGPARPQPARCAACRAVHISTLPHLLPHAKHCCPFQINPGELRRAPFSIPPLPATPKMAASLPPYPPSPAEHAPNPTAPIRFAHAIF